MKNSSAQFSSPAPAPRQLGIELLLAISREEYGLVIPRLKRLLDDVEGLYAGRWPSHEACEVLYHDFSHALDAALAAARIAAGWNRSHPSRKLDTDLFCAAVAAGLFHDAGYIKDKGDHEGRGGKFTTTHVQRGMELAAGYLKQARWPERAAEIVPIFISLTDYHQEPEIDQLFSDELERTVARMIPTADLIAQIADNRYIEKLDSLFVEFKEMYEFHDQQQLTGNGAPIFRSAQEIRDGVIDFYGQFVTPRLEKFGRMDQYLPVYFGANRNPYHENIAANLSSHLLGPGIQWQRLGEVLKTLGLINDQQLNTALNQQRQLRQATKQLSSEQAKNTLLHWMGCRDDNLGDILLEMKALSPAALAHGLAQQILPEKLIHSLNTRELQLLLLISVLIQHLNKGPWLLTKIMQLLNELLRCEASSLMLVDSATDEMLIVLPTDQPGPNPPARRLPVDKGLAGWVFRNGKPAMAPNILADQHFELNGDPGSNSSARSLLAVPLFINGPCLGVLEAMNKTDGFFNQHDLQKLTILANMLAGTFAAIIARYHPPSLPVPPPAR